MITIREPEVFILLTLTDHNLSANRPIYPTIKYYGDILNQINMINDKTLILRTKPAEHWL